MTKPHYPKISIITPSYNQGQFIKETIDSVLDQNYPNLEYWVIDGGSTDNTVKILKKYGTKIKWVSEKDRGQTHAINKGLKKASGEIIAYLNSDDVYLPNSLFTIADYFMKHPDIMWLTGDYVIIDELGHQIQSGVAWYKRLFRTFPGRTSLMIGNYIIQPSTFWRSQVVKKLACLMKRCDIVWTLIIG
jgi:glycosyltransferase involved in cell wall biosynthesis